MINFIKRYYKHFVFAFSILLVFVCSCFYNYKENNIKVSKKQPLSSKNEKQNSEDESLKTVFVDVNGDSKLVTPECIKNNYFK